MATAHDNASVVTGFSAVLGITLFGVTLALFILLISLVKRKLHESSHRTRTQGMCMLCYCLVFSSHKNMLFPFPHKTTMTMEHCLADTTHTHSPGSKPQETSATVATNAIY